MLFVCYRVRQVTVSVLIQVLWICVFSRPSVKHKGPSTCFRILRNSVWYSTYCSWSSSVSTVYDYRLEDRDRSPSDVKDFSYSLCVQTNPKAHSASYPMGTRGIFVGAKGGRNMTLATHLHLMPRSRMSRNYSYITLLLGASMA
jgi:hypothetical protein